MTHGSQHLCHMGPDSGICLEHGVCALSTASINRPIPPAFPVHICGSQANKAANETAPLRSRQISRKASHSFQLRSLNGAEIIVDVCAAARPVCWHCDAYWSASASGLARLIR